MDPAGGAQAVAVQDGADPSAVREGDGGGAVPGLHQAGMVLVEGLPQRAHGFVPAPGLRHHHHQGMGQGPARHVEQLEDIVEHRGVRSVQVDDRQHLLQVVPENAGFEKPLAALHPVHVAAQRIDLAVVGDVVVGMGPGPAREGVGGEPRMHHRQPRHKPVFSEIGIEGSELLGVQHSLVDDRPAGEAGDVEMAPAWEHRAGHPLLRQAPDHVELPLEIVLGGRLGPARDEHLADDRLAGPGRDAQGGVVRGHIPPSEHPLPLFLRSLLEDPLAGVAVAVVGRQEQHPDAVLCQVRGVRVRSVDNVKRGRRGGSG